MSEHKTVTYVHVADMPDMVMSVATMQWNKTGSWRYIKPMYLDRTPPCNAACPAGNDIEGFIRLIGEKRFLDAWKLLKEENPFPKVCGRVCFHPCETFCNRSKYDRAVSINALERFAGDHAIPDKKPTPLKKPTGKKIAIIGSGPAGLTAAYHLARMGHKAVVYEAAPLAGGLLRLGIPEYRLPKSVLDEEIADIAAWGVEIRCNAKVGDNVQLKEMDSFDAVFIAIGVQANQKLGISGEDSVGVLSGLHFLNNINMGKTVSLGSKVVVIGGGNSAVDAARTARRLGCHTGIYYRRSKAEMPAFDAEVDDAVREGVELHLLVAPTKIIASNRKVNGVEFTKMKLGDPDESGRRKPIPIPGSEFIVKADNVITAIGERGEFDFLKSQVQLEKSKIAADEWGQTGKKGIFAGGDAALNDQTVAYAIGSGKRAACAIDIFLSGKMPKELGNKFIIGGTGSISVARYLNEGTAHAKNIGQKETVKFEELNLAHFAPSDRSKMPRISVAERIKSFAEVNLGLSESAALHDADRCFHCGVCTMCDNCWVFCPDAAVSHLQNAYGYEFNYFFCKGCGICAKECPRSCIVMEQE